MSESRWTPEAFARVLSFAADHPERLAAERDVEFQALRRLLAEFEQPGPSGLSLAERAGAESALAARLERAVGALPVRGVATTSEARAVAAAPDARPVAPTRGTRNRATTRGWEWLWAPALRPAFATAALIVIAGGVWWSATRAPGHIERGAVEAPYGGIAWRAPEASAGRLEMAWSPVGAAETYRVRFLDAESHELARVDSLASPSCTLERASLPPGLASGAEVYAEVDALAGGDVIAHSAARALRVP